MLRKNDAAQQRGGFPQVYLSVPEVQNKRNAAIFFFQSADEWVQFRRET